MVEITPETVNSLFLSLRSSDTTQNQSASNLLQKISRRPETIIAIFALLKTTTDIMIRCHAYYTLALCFRNLICQMDDNTFLMCRQTILEFLQNETDIRCINSLFSVIHTLYLESATNSRPNWDELHKFLLSLDYCQSKTNLYESLTLFQFLLDYFPSELLEQNIAFFQNLIMAGFQFKETSTVIPTESIKLLYRICKKLKQNNSHKNLDYSIFSPYSLELFFLQYENNDCLIFQTLQALLNAIRHGMYIFPFEIAYPRIMQMLQRDYIEFEIHSSVHFFTFICLKDSKYSVLLTKENWLELFQFELLMTNRFILHQRDELVRDDFEDISAALCIILQKFPDINIITFTFENVQRILNGEDLNISLICFVLILFYSVIKIYEVEDFTEDQLMFMFTVFIQALTSSSPVVVQLSMKFLSMTSEFFEKKLNDAKIDIMSLLENLLRGPFCEGPLVLLNDFACILDDSDPIFDRLFPICSQLISMNNTMIPVIGYQTLAETIKRSKVVASQQFDNIHKLISPIIRAPALISETPHSLVFSILSALIPKSTKQCLPTLNEFVNCALQALSISPNPYAMQNILPFIIDVYLNSDLCEHIDPELTRQFFTFFYNRIDRDWSNDFLRGASEGTYQFSLTLEEFNTASQALYALSIIISLCEDYKTSYFIFYNCNLFIQNINQIRAISFCKVDCVLQALLRQLQNSTISAAFLNRDIYQDLDLTLGVESRKSDDITPLINAIIPFLTSIGDNLRTMLQYITNGNNEVLILVIKLFTYFFQANLIDSEVSSSLLELIFSKKIGLKIAAPIGRLISTMNSAGIPFDLLYAAISTFIKDLLLSPKNSSLITGLSFVSQLQANISTVLFSPEILPFTEQIPAIILNQESDVYVIKYILKVFLSYIKLNCDKMPIDVQFGNNLLMAAKNRLEFELSSGLTSLKDNLAVFISLFGCDFVGDDYPFNDFIPLVLTSIPFSFDTDYASDVYLLLSIVFPLHISDPEMNNQYIIKMINLLSCPYSQLEAIDLNSLILNSIINSLKASLVPEIQDEEIQSQALLDKVRNIVGLEQFAMFYDTYINSIKDFSVCISSIMHK